MSDPRDDIFAVAAMLTELDRVLHPLERGEAGSFKVDPPLPPPLPTPTSQGRAGEGGRSAKAVPLGPRSAPSSAPRNVLSKHAAENVQPVQARAPSPAVSAERTRRRVPRPESMTARMVEVRETVGEATPTQDVKQAPSRGPVPVDGVPDVGKEAIGAPPSRHPAQGRDLPAPTHARPDPTGPDARVVEAQTLMAERAEAPLPRRRTRVPRPSIEGVERDPARRPARARVPEEATRRHRVPTFVSREPLVPPVESGSSAAPVPRQRSRRHALSADVPLVPGPRPTRSLPSNPRTGDQPARPTANASRSPAQSQREATLESPPVPARSAGRPALGPVHIEVNTLVPPPPRIEAPTVDVLFDEEPQWAEVPEPESDTGARAFFVNGRRVTREDHETLQQAEQRLRRRMTGRSLWRRRG